MEALFTSLLQAAALRAEFPDLVNVMPDNQSVVDGSDWIFLGILPRLVDEILAPLKFRKEQIVVSLLSTATHAKLQEVLDPVPKENIVRAIPLPPVAKHVGATILNPPHEEVEAVFNHLGNAV